MKKNVFLIAVILIVTLLPINNSIACTGIKLIAKDGSVVYGRTMEWGSFDLGSRVAIIPRGYSFTGLTPDGLNGKVYKSKYGVVGLDMIGTDYIGDGMNEKGLSIGMFYHPDFAEYQEYLPSEASNTLTVFDITNYILTQFATVDEVKTGMQDVRVVGVVEKAIAMIVQGHWMVTDASGASIVIEYTKSELKIYDAPLGVITNSPNYDWHLTNLSNYINLSQTSFPAKQISGIEVKQIGAGSGMLGLPGDNTPPSRFIRAAAWTQTARDLPDAKETIYELFRILDNFNLPQGPGAAEGAGESNSDDLMRSSTIWTTAWNLSDLTLNYHTQHNRRVRKLDLKEIDFSNIGDKILHIKLDESKEQDFDEIKL